MDANDSCAIGGLKSYGWAELRNGGDGRGERNKRGVEGKRKEIAVWAFAAQKRE